MKTKLILLIGILPILVQACAFTSTSEPVPAATATRTPVPTGTLEPTSIVLTEVSTAAAAPTSFPSPTPCLEAEWVVLEGDTLVTIADAFGVTPDAIVNYNGLDTNVPLFVGQQLFIPHPAVCDLFQQADPIGLQYECDVDGQIVMSAVPCDQWGYDEPTDTMMPPLWLIPGENDVSCTSPDEISFAGSQMSPHIMGDTGATSVCVHLRGGLTYFFINDENKHLMTGFQPSWNYKTNVIKATLDCPGYEQLKLFNYALYFYGDDGNARANKQLYDELSATAGFSPPLLIPSFTYDGIGIVCSLSIQSEGNFTLYLVGTER